MTKSNIDTIRKEYLSFSGSDLVATCFIRGLNLNPYVLGELSTLSYSTHMDRKPVRALGNINVKDYTNGPRTIAGTLVFAQFDKHFANNIMEDIKEQSGTKHEIMADEIPPFDITITAANEYGAQAVMAIYGVRLVNEGLVMSVNDVFTENTYQYVAADLEYFKSYDEKVAFYRGKNSFTIRNSTYSPKKITTKNISTKSKGYGTDSNPEIADSVYNTKKVDVPRYDGNIDVVYPVFVGIVDKIDIPTTVDINIKELQPARQNKKGKAVISLFPQQTEGHLRITNINDNSIFDYSVGNFASNIYIPLYAGQYYADYINSNENIICERKSFNISTALHNDKETEDIVKMMSLVNTAPLIIDIGHDYAIVAPNVRTHTAIKYFIKGTNTIKSANIIKGEAVLNNLSSNCDYTMYSTPDIGDYSSDYAEFTTLEYKIKNLENFVSHMTNNSNLLKYNLDKYQGIFDSVLQTQMSSSLEAIKKIRNSRQIESEEAKERISELLYFSTIYESNREKYNNKALDLEPPHSDVLNHENERIHLDANTNSVAVMKFNDKIDLEKRIGKDLFLKDNIIRHNLKEDIIYIAQSTDKYSRKSPRKFMYSNNESDKVSRLKKYESDKEYKEALIKANLFIPSDKYSREMAIVIAQRPAKPMCQKPIISDIINNSIYLTIDINNAAYKKGDIHICIKELEDSLIYSYPVYKKLVRNENTTIAFKDFFFNSKNKYVIYLEQDGHRISEASYYSADESELYSVESSISEQFKVFYKNKVSDSLARSTIDTIDDLIINNETILSQFINKLINAQITANKRNSIISMIQAWKDVSLKDSNINITINNTVHDLLLSSDSQVYFKCIYYGENSTKQEIIKQTQLNIIKNKQYKYVVIHTIDESLNYVFGTILYDVFNNTINVIKKGELIFNGHTI